MKTTTEAQFIADGIQFLIHRANQTQDEKSLLILAEIYKGTGAELEERVRDHQDKVACALGARVLKKLKSSPKTPKKR